MKMRVTIIFCLGGFLSPAAAQESAQERLAKFKASQGQIAQLQEKVEKAPDDQKAYRALLEAGLDQYELIYAREHYPADIRENILKLKVVMEDMYTLQESINESGMPVGVTVPDLLQRLKAQKVRYARRRSVPLIDPWGTPYRFFIFPENGQYKIVSAGSDKKFDPENLRITEDELRQAPEKRSSKMSDDIVFIDGRNFTKIYDYPKKAQTFLYTRCRPADEVRKVRCW
ncbi:MAG: hypothetical protein HY077_00370 [Elusimicrobia bacterium]|nr:hypothetical protein [Elusimicrobiota bacterium]